MAWRVAIFEWAGVRANFYMVWHRICLGGRICIHNLVSFDLQANNPNYVQNTKKLENFVRMCLFLAYSDRWTDSENALFFHNNTSCCICYRLKSKQAKQSISFGALSYRIWHRPLAPNKFALKCMPKQVGCRINNFIGFYQNQCVSIGKFVKLLYSILMSQFWLM